ncbi:putative ARS binding protein Abp2 [Aspergillus clavatus NRRL 1]|uniref:ARS binding protein Abp2, putative n=1 Tax=Aspergillus clavatus (strain ATCC 1007 / CBS 513.65 / DSM 816 / NCTC 3887 / NRRL 1 / QM 1276 / 107) TaxID=344612 RepID=A1CS59_ASPCL|nr:ARS binding protein Abp2, putative [Aspergillus clavatus NRRL 1]EAW08480.1 ARS binding protein Abp2, putative [Aspergillus clavatus NRRL 1]
MESSFSSVIPPTDRNDIGGTPGVIQQYARYPSTLEPGLQSSSSLGSARSRLGASKSPPLHRKATPRSIQSSPTGLRSVIPPVSATRAGPSMSPPMYDPLRQRQGRDSIEQAESRTLPSRDVSDDTIDDAYVMFILFCNPNVPVSVDTAELRKTFRSPPRSDGKSFSIFTLWELIRKLDNKELKTWIQLAIELGVEPPSAEKKQSTQKVQQYAVRLKRWMRAMHVDAFFEYCLGHPHPYYTQLPASNAAVSETRDGVPLEEDLALRALVPEWKPKRGRKRADERDHALDRGAKRPQLDTSVGVLQAGSFTDHSATFPHSAIPFSAFPNDDHWMTAAPSFPADGSDEHAVSQQGQELRWRPLGRDASPAGYPHSAIIPRGHHPSDGFLPSAEPRSAVDPSPGEKSRSRRRHGPAVSSAWPNSNASITGKTRGRPPQRGIISGPFSTFPLNPPRTDSSQAQGPGSRSSPAIILDQSSAARSGDTPYQQLPTPFSHTTARPNKLQLQVPQHSGGPVRLATPPTLMVNGISNPSASLKVEPNKSNGSAAPSNGMWNGSTMAHIIPNAAPHAQADQNPSAQITFDDVTRVLSSELLRAKLTGRPAPLSAEEARALAFSIVRNLSASYARLPAGLSGLASALHLGLGPQFGYATSTQSSMVVNVGKVPITAVDAAGASGNTRTSPNYAYTVSHEFRHGSQFLTKTVYSDLGVFGTEIGKPDDVSRITDDIGNSVVELDGLTDAEYEIDGAEGTGSETTWKQRYMKLRAQMQKRERSLSQYKRKILESVMADI